MSGKDVEWTLAGRASYDPLGERGQAFVRAAWDDRIEEAAGALDLASEMAAIGESWSEIDENGAVVTRGPEAADR